MNNNIQRIELVTFNSFFPSKKEEIMKSKIKEIEEEGFHFLEAKPVPFTKNIKHLGGALNLHFEKNKD